MPIENRSDSQTGYIFSSSSHTQHRAAISVFAWQMMYDPMLAPLTMSISAIVFWYQGIEQTFEDSEKGPHVGSVQRDLGKMSCFTLVLHVHI